MFLSTGFFSVISSSLNKIFPRVGIINPEIILSNVVFPHPEGPSKAYAPPSSQSIFTFMMAQSSSLLCDFK